MSSRTPLVVGNWKSNGDTAASQALLGRLRDAAGAALGAGVQVVVCPPYPYLAASVARLSGSGIEVGAQDVSEHGEGAYTGAVTATMLADVGCRYAIVGHSERRTLFGETDERVAAKARCSLAAGLVPIVCVGETLAQRDADQTEETICAQVDAVAAVVAAAPPEAVVLAYEPVWAIGTGRSATPEQAQAVHGLIRARLAGRGVAHADRVRLLYGGSVKPTSAAGLFAMPDIDGGLIGGASLSADDFVAICEAAAPRQ